MSYVDLHLHTNHSDGADAPERVVERAAGLGISAIAITDHDTVSGVAAARDAAEAAGIAFLTGTEISTSFEGREVHVLGLGVDIGHAGLGGGLETLQRARHDRAVEIVARLRDLEIDIDFESILARTGDGVIGRMHIANELKGLGVISVTQEAFDRYLNPGRPAYAPKGLLPAAAAVDLIHASGGLALVAHPGLGKATRKLLARLLRLPFDGIEAYHISHSPARTDGFLGLAAERGLLVSGGSDCHGTIKGRSAEMGKVRTPHACFERLMEALSTVR